MWKDLSMQQRADLMDIYLSYGVTSLDEMRNHYDSRNQYSEGGSIHIKPENRGKFTRLKERTGHSASWFKAHGTPAQKKMATFALNAKKWKHGYGGNLYDGITESTQQMQTGKDYWKQLANKPTWLDTFTTPINGGQLPEVVVTPTDDEKWLFSIGKYARNSRKPLADYYTKKVVADYLSKFDDENAIDYNARIKRLADAIYDTNGVIFQKNDVKEGKLKGRAHYNHNTGVAKIDSMDDIFAELAHPYQSWLGNNRKGDEISEEYDNDKDPRGGTRYAYPDTYEGETHGFFEPTLKEWVETGKIGRSLPILDKKLSKEKIVPEDRSEVTDSAASWNKQAIDKRVIANPHQLPLTKRIQYSIWDYPLLNKKRTLRRNLFDGTSQPTQQMNNGKVLVTNSYGDNYYIDPRQVNSTEWNLTTPEVSVTANPDDVARGRAERWFRDFGTESNDANTIYFKTFKR